MKKPNVIVIFADDLGVGDVSAFNKNSKIHTKRIDELASEGMIFTNSHSSSALCTPSRYSLLTGRYNFRSRLKFSVLPGDSEALIERDRVTMANFFKSQGYKTAVVGKWHLGIDWNYLEEVDWDKYGIEDESLKQEKFDVQRGRNGVFDAKYKTYLVEGVDIDYSKPVKFGPNNIGFDYSYIMPASLDQPPYVYLENGKVEKEPTTITGEINISRYNSKTQQKWQLGVATDDYSHVETPEIMQKKVLNLIDKYSKSDEPFFIYYPTPLVHGPLLPHKEDLGKSKIGIYGDFVLQLDRYVGEIVELLKKKEIFDDTMIIFTSDNGASAVANYPYLLSVGHNPSNGLRGKKAEIWEGGHTEPTIVTYPRLIKKGSISNKLVGHMDFFRTFSDMFSVDLEDTVAEDSVSNLSIWKGKDEEVRDYIIHSSGNGGLSIRNSKWKLTFVENGGFSYNEKNHFKPTELYRIDVDNEHNNLIEQFPEIVEEMKNILEKYIKDGRSTKGKKQKNNKSLPNETWEQVEWIDEYETFLKELK